MPESAASKPVAEWIDEIPTRPSPFKATVASVAAALLAALGYGIWKYGPPALEVFLDRNGNAAILLEKNGLSAALSL